MCHFSTENLQCSQPDARDSIGEYMETKGLPLLLIMTVAQHPTFHRQLAVIPAVSLWYVPQFCSGSKWRVSATSFKKAG